MRETGSSAQGGRVVGIEAIVFPSLAVGMLAWWGILTGQAIMVTETISLLDPESLQVAKEVLSEGASSLGEADATLKEQKYLGAAAIGAVAVIGLLVGAASTSG